MNNVCILKWNKNIEYKVSRSTWTYLIHELLLQLPLILWLVGAPILGNVPVLIHADLNDIKLFFLFVTDAPPEKPRAFVHGTLTEGEGWVQLTSLR